MGYHKTAPANSRSVLGLALPNPQTVETESSSGRALPSANGRRILSYNARWGKSGQGNESDTLPTKPSQEKCSPTLPGPRLPSLNQTHHERENHHNGHLTRETFSSHVLPMARYSPSQPKGIRETSWEKLLSSFQAAPRCKAKNIKCHCNTVHKSSLGVKPQKKRLLIQ